MMMLFNCTNQLVPAAGLGLVLREAAYAPYE
jgi:hypothetical protein